MSLVYLPIGIFTLGTSVFSLKIFSSILEMSTNISKINFKLVDQKVFLQKVVEA